MKIYQDCFLETKLKNFDRMIKIPGMIYRGTKINRDDKESGGILF